jgi:V-type H+-transporting ATPase subunit D
MSGDYSVDMSANGSGVYLPTFESVTEGGSDFGLTGLGRGGQQVQK